MAAHHQGAQVCWSRRNAASRLGSELQLGGATLTFAALRSLNNRPAEWRSAWITALNGSSGFRVTRGFSHQVSSPLRHSLPVGFIRAGGLMPSHQLSNDSIPLVQHPQPAPQLLPDVPDVPDPNLLVSNAGGSGRADALKSRVTNSPVESSLR